MCLVFLSGIYFFRKTTHKAAEKKASSQAGQKKTAEKKKRRRQCHMENGHAAKGQNEHGTGIVHEAKIEVGSPAVQKPSLVLVCHERGTSRIAAENAKQQKGRVGSDFRQTEPEEAQCNKKGQQCGEQFIQPKSSAVFTSLQGGFRTK